MRHLAAVSVVTVGAVVTLVGTFLTWVRSGSAGRSSYEVFAIVDRLGFSPDGVVGIALRGWPLVPLLLAVAVGAHWWRVNHPFSRPATIGVTLAAAAYPGAIAVVVTNAPEITLFDVGRGPLVTVSGSVIMLAGLVMFVSATRGGRARRPSAPEVGRS
jgi:hypothetical protein